MLPLKILSYSTNSQRENICNISSFIKITEKKGKTARLFQLSSDWYYLCKKEYAEEDDGQSPLFTAASTLLFRLN